MRSRWLGGLLAILGLLWLMDLLLRIDPLRAGLALVLTGIGYWLVRGGRWLVGRIDWTHREALFEGFDLSCLFADVKIDLSRAIVGPGEHPITVRGLIGDVKILLPRDLEASVEASVTFGGVSVMGADRAGLGRRYQFRSTGYGEAQSRVKIALVLTAGNLDVDWL